MTSSAIRAATIDSKRQWRVASTIPIAIGWIGMRIKHIPLSWEEFFIFKFEMVARMMRRDIAMLLESIFVCHFSYSGRRKNTRLRNKIRPRGNATMTFCYSSCFTRM